MKKVFNTSELPHIWATQKQNEGTAGSFYFRGKTIYSYGNHFPIATIEGEKVFFTLRRYSNTTAKHISKTRQAISHKEFIFCFEVPTRLGNETILECNKKGYLKNTHEINFKQWQKNIETLLAEIGNPKNRSLEGRILDLNNNIIKLEIYCNYFGLKIKHNSFKSLLVLAKSEDIINLAKNIQSKVLAAKLIKLKIANKAHNEYLKLWRNNDNEGIQELSQKNKDLCNFYQTNSESFTHLRYNTSQNRLETTKGIQIPVEIARKAYLALNSCLDSKCENLNIDIMSYTITKTTENAIIAGCHTIPKEDVKYIATLLNW